MSANTATVDRIEVITTGHAGAHPEHVYGTRKPDLWWVFRSKEWVDLPVNVFVIEHPDGLVLFDTGADPKVVEPDYWPDRITKLFMDNIFKWDIGPEDRLSTQLTLAGYDAADVRLAIMSHLHFDHAGGIGDIPQADLWVSPDAWDHLLGPHPEREAVKRRDLLVPGAKWRHLEFSSPTDAIFDDFDKACDVLGDGSLVALPTPGHMPGSISLFVRRTDAPPVLLIGDLTYSEELLQRDQVAGTGDAAVLRDSYARVRGLAARVPGLVIVASHDHSAAEKLTRHRVPAATAVSQSTGV